MGRKLNPRFLSCPEGTSYCVKCENYKPLSSFHKNSNGWNGLNFYCKDCVKLSDEKYKDTRALRSKRDNYGIPEKEYLRLWLEQGGCCAICGLPEARMHKGTPASLSVDHNHQTGKIRGLLCHACNVGLGAFRDDRDLVEKAMNYLHDMDDERTQNKRGEVNIRMVSKQKVDTQEMIGAVYGLPKKISGSLDDFFGLPLFSE